MVNAEKDGFVFGRTRTKYYYGQSQAALARMCATKEMGLWLYYIAQPTAGENMRPGKVFFMFFAVARCDQFSRYLTN